MPNSESVNPLTDEQWEETFQYLNQRLQELLADDRYQLAGRFGEQLASALMVLEIGRKSDSASETVNPLLRSLFAVLTRDMHSWIQDHYHAVPDEASRELRVNLIGAPYYAVSCLRNHYLFEGSTYIGTHSSCAGSSGNYIR